MINLHLLLTKAWQSHINCNKYNIQYSVVIYKIIQLQTIDCDSTVLQDLLPSAEAFSNNNEYLNFLLSSHRLLKVCWIQQLKQLCVTLFQKQQILWKRKCNKKLQKYPRILYMKRLKMLLLDYVMECNTQWVIFCIIW